jgi:hypothetical protein
MTMNQNAFASAARAAQARSNLGDTGHWYPCGFAWVSAPKMRKNAKGFKDLVAAGFSWNDYDKRYQLWAGTFTGSQSMDFKEAIAQAYVNTMQAHGFDGFSVGSRID